MNFLAVFGQIHDVAIPVALILAFGLAFGKGKAIDMARQVLASAVADLEKEAEVKHEELAQAVYDKLPTPLHMFLTEATVDLLVQEALKALESK